MKVLVPRPGLSRRRAIALSHDHLVNEGWLGPTGTLPVLIEPATSGVDLTEWLKKNRVLIQSRVFEYGAVLLRGFNVRSVERFQHCMIALAGDLLEYSYRSTPRTQISGRIYTSTEYPAHQTIPLHNEMSYSGEWPMLLAFCCIVPAASGGQTPIADSRKVFQRIPIEVRERFSTAGVMYVRNYGDDLDLPWRDVFQTDDRSVVEDYCRRAGISFEWKNGDRLRTTQICQAVAKHPHTGETVWFNQAHLFHISSLEADVRDSLQDSEGAEPPRNAFYGDGSEIEEAVLDVIRTAYERETTDFAWEQGDVLIFDNMLTAHGRRSYTGPRETVVAMARSFAD